MRALLLVTLVSVSRLAAASDQTPSQDIDVQVTLTSAEAGRGEQQGLCGDASLHAEPHGGTSREPRHLDLPETLFTEPFASATLRLAEGTWTISLNSQSCWAAPEIVVVPQTTKIRLHVERLGEVHLRPRVQPGNEPFEEARVKFFFAQGATDPSHAQSWIADGAADCVLEKNNAGIRCAVPEGTLDLMLTSPGVASRYYWGRAVVGGKTTELADWVVRPGASLAGWVADTGVQTLSEVSVVVSRESSGRASSPEQQRRVGRSKRAVRPSKKGFFQVSGLDEGIYTVEASRATASAGPFRVTLAAKRETLLKTPLTLEEPFSFDVNVVPTAGPDGTAWRLELAPVSRAAGRYEKPRTVSIDPATGLGRFSGVKPGRFALWLKDAKRTSWWFDQIDIRREDASTFIALDIVEVCGTVSLGDEPLQAQLHFGGQYGAVRQSAKTDEEGHFTLLLPREGRWQVDVASDDPAVKRKLQKVDVQHKPAKGCAPVAIRLPDTLVRGVVLDEEEMPIHPALVQVAPLSDGTLEPLAQVATLGEDGVFELHGYPEGSLMLSAHVYGKSSDQEVVTLDEDHEAPWVELVVKDHLYVKGKVVSPSGAPVPGAKVFARGVDAVIAITNHTTTNLDGTFEMEISPPSNDVILSVLAAGYALTTRLHQNIDSADVLLQVSPASGRLELAMPRSSFRLSDATRPVLFNESGLGIGLWILKQWSTINGASSSLETETLVLPALESGAYTGCMVRTSQARALAPDMIPSQGCTTAFVAVGGSERLELSDPL